MVETKDMIIGVVVAIALLVAFTPVLFANISNADNQYKCLNPTFSIQSTDDLLCTNATYSCGLVLPVYNASTNLCTNSSGVGKYNATPLTGFSAYNESSTDVGLNTTETTLLGLIVLFIVLGILFTLVKASGLM